MVPHGGICLMTGALSQQPARSCVTLLTTRHICLLKRQICDTIVMSARETPGRHELNETKE